MTMWMVRAETDGHLFQPFLEKGVVAIGWFEVGNLGILDSRDDFVEKVRKVWPDWKNQKQINSAGMLFRFKSEIKSGDRVITYDKKKRLYAVGTIVGDYSFEPRFDEEFPNVRAVRWDKTDLSRDSLGTATKNSLGSTLTLFLVPSFAELDVLVHVDSGTVSSPKGPESVEEQEDLLNDIEERSIEFIKDKIVRLDWQEMQELVAGLLRAMGYKTRVSPTGPDRGKDIIASPDGFGFEDPRIVVEVKHRPKEVIGAPGIRGFIGGRHSGDKGLYVSTGGFSKDALYEAERANIPLVLMDLDSLVDTFIAHYPNMDTETRSLVPLKSVYWPIA